MAHVKTYGYEIWFDGCCIHDEEGFQSYEEAEEDADEMVLSYIDEWEMDEYEPIDFDIRVMAREAW